MCEWTLENEKVQASLAHFVKEARMCSRMKRGGGVMGVAAMSTILSCVVALGEALCQHRGQKDRELHKFFRAFHEQMTDGHSWLLPPVSGSHRDTEPWEVLYNIRNDLAHAVAMPFSTELCPDEETARAASPDKWRLVVPNFVDAVKETIDKLRQELPNLSLERVMSPARRRRGPVVVLTSSTSSSDHAYQAWDTMGLSEKRTVTGSE